jgi:16S rRNA (guanine527-N7)-methyltransferase
MVAQHDGHIEDEPDAASQVFGERIEVARRYVVALATDGVVRGLIGPRESGRLWTRHVLNSGVVGPLLGDGAAVVDVGSGAGLPGIPLAIARPDCRVVLVEPLERRTIFLQEMVDGLSLTNCRVVRGRADQVIDECGGADVVTSRAVAPLAKLAAWSAPLLRVGGQLLAMKGESAGAEIERDRSAVAAVGLVDLDVVTAGAGLVDPPTIVIQATRVALRGNRSRGAVRRSR